MKSLPQAEIARLLAHPGVQRSLSACREGDVVWALRDDDEFMVNWGPGGREYLIERGIDPATLKTEWPQVLLVRQRVDPADPDFEELFVLRVRRGRVGN